MTVPLDDIDQAMVEALRRDSRLSVRELAAHLGISRAGAYARFNRLRDSGVIVRFGAVVDPRKLGLGFSAYISLRIRQRSWKAVREQLAAIPEIEQAALVSGEFDIILLVRTRDAAALRDLVLERLQAMPEVLSTNTIFIMDESTRP